MSLLGNSGPGRTVGDVPGPGKMDGEVEIEMDLESRQWRLEGGGLGLRAIVKSQGVLIMG